MREIDHAKVEEFLLNEEEDITDNIFVKLFIGLNSVILKLQSNGTLLSNVCTIFDGDLDNYIYLKHRMDDCTV